MAVTVTTGVFVPEEYELPIAGNEVLGGAKVGDGLEIEEDGHLNVKELKFATDADIDEIFNQKG
nr:MAG TPA: hypothetical protein [Caudoviricetes sp.]